MDKKKAIELVLDYEKKQGRNPQTVNKFRNGYDIKSGDRLIEIKINERDSDLLVSFKGFKKLGKNVVNYYIYVLNGDEEKPKLKILEPEFILRNFNLLTLVKIKSDSIKKVGEINLT
ncbi:MAG: hypothetical protein KatS3mg001_338 [Candidatus Pacearchaeota archaeon]|nr:MAG: hypothetical protein KatS3mg001_338 [Candidatus Pacearchaeota archaeon]